MQYLEGGQHVNGSIFVVSKLNGKLEVIYELDFTEALITTDTQTFSGSSLTSMENVTLLPVQETIMVPTINPDGSLGAVAKNTYNMPTNQVSYNLNSIKN